MSVSKTDKYKLIAIFILTLLLVGMLYYKFVVLANNIAKANEPSVPKAVLQVPTNDEPLKAVAQKPRTVSLGKSAKSEIQKTEVIEYTDGSGNPVQAILEPIPHPLTSKRGLQLSAEDRQIVMYMRDNLLLELQAANETLKAKKAAAKAPVAPDFVNRSGTTPKLAYATNANMPQDLVGFAEVETVKPTFLGGNMSKADLEEAFEVVEVASITVDDNPKAPVRAYVRINGKLFNAVKGRRIGDFEIKQVEPSHVDIRYIPANVSKKIGHTGFTNK
ncbi:hypothetical protein [Enterovibrio norvegicus]|uniref:hypothetical protein n=1 Tax=Enterovibrio norvegicus TaxID=188144 RepID=UPI000C85B93E|nr:hypothetical protein [Enterovibrio norvegicus]PMH64443.1 hypothetical protein BCU62_15425 [Enterovibrio norvegicus]